MNEIAQSSEYLSFRSSVPQKKICVDDDGKKEWTIYDMGSKSVKSPLICFPPVSGRADVYFKQMLALSAAGFRVISVEYPICWNLKEFCEGFQKLLAHLHLNRVHLFGASLGGFLVQRFAQYTCSVKRVQSLILCNAFTDTGIFEQRMAAPTFWMLPALMLKTMVMGNLDSGAVEKDIGESISFIVTSLNSLSQKELASRLTLNCQKAVIDTKALQSTSITIIDVNDDCALSQAVKDDLHAIYPNARRAHLKSGGNFPYLSRASELNVFLQIHLREFNATPHSAMHVDVAETDIDAVDVASAMEAGATPVSRHHGMECGSLDHAAPEQEPELSPAAADESFKRHRQATQLNSLATAAL